MLEKEKMRNVIERAWIHNILIEELWEAVVLEDKLKVIKKTIEDLKNDVNKSWQEVRMLQSKLSMNEA